jgi:DNA polymerase kappa
MYADKVNAMKQQLGSNPNHILELYKRDKSRVELAKQLAYEKSANYRKMITVDKVWLHLDMDMFYVACELLDKPELKEKPCAVGGMAMISTANYVAR